MKKTIVLYIFVILSSFSVYSQTTFQVVFYNVENLFDTVDEPKKDDTDFLPEGKKHWTYGKYKNKLNNIAKVITSIGEWGYPALIGLCEVENETVMDDLTKYSPLKNQEYKYVMTNSKDPRGIDVALMYQRDQFNYIGHHSYRIKFPKNKQKRTRDILHVTGKVASGDILDVFVCHFPSRRGGELESEPGRIHVASILRSKVDSLMKIRSKANIIIMGDFNDEPSNKSIYETLNAREAKGKSDDNQLYNLFHSFEKEKNTGTYKFKDQWNLLDQIIVSGNLLNRKQKFYAKPESATIYKRDFLLVDDKTNGGKRPKKTYNGMKHEGGYSDHLPIFVEFYVSSHSVKK